MTLSGRFTGRKRGRYVGTSPAFKRRRIATVARNRRRGFGDSGWGFQPTKSGYRAKARYRKRRVYKKKTKVRAGQGGTIVGRKDVRPRNAQAPTMIKGETIQTPKQLLKWLKSPIPSEKVKGTGYERAVISCRHIYTQEDEFSVAPTAGADIQLIHTFMVNSAFDFDHTGAGHQPTGFDLMASRYEHNFVTSVDYKMKVRTYYKHDTADETVAETEVYFLMWLSLVDSTVITDLTTLESWKEYLSIGGGKRGVNVFKPRLIRLPVPQATNEFIADADKDHDSKYNPGVIYLKGTLNPSSLPLINRGVTTDDIRIKQKYVATNSADPAAPIYLHCCVVNKDNWSATSDSEVDIRLDAVIHTTWYEPILTNRDLINNT